MMGPLLVLALIALVFCVLRFFHLTRPRSLSRLPPRNSLFEKSAIEIAEMIRAGALTSIEVTEACIQRIEAVNPVINAFAAQRFDAARNEARAVDAQLSKFEGDVETLPPLLGVPVSIKECFAVVDMPNTAGFHARVGRKTLKDASVVARLRAAGAIILGVTNTSELCMWYETNNRIYGRTNNPYDLRRTVGGSSGGEGAAATACCSFAGVGSDVGGSIRMPAFFNGVFGHKPSAGVVPNTGQHPIAEGGGLRFLCTGPICRRAADLFPLLKIMKGEDGVDPETRNVDFPDPSVVNVGALNVIVVYGNEAPIVSPLTKDMRAAVDRVASHLRSLGCTISVQRFPLLKRSFEIWSSCMDQHAKTSFSMHMSLLTKVDHVMAWLKFWCLRSPHTFPALLLASTEFLPKLLPKMAVKSIEQATVLRDQFISAFYQYDTPASAQPEVTVPSVTKRSRSKSPRRAARTSSKQPTITVPGANTIILFPSFPVVAPYHNKPLLRPLDFTYTSIFNTMGFPVTQVPTGLNAQGLPTGVQVVGAPLCDHVTIAVALELERAFGGWVDPFRSQ